MICFVFAAVCISDDSCADGVEETTSTTITIDGVTYTAGSNNTATITAYDNTTKAVTIKAKVTIDGTEYNVTSIPKGIFNGKSIETLAIEEGITTIIKEAFKGCTALTSVSIPKSVTTIGDSAFNGCTLLNNVTITVSDDDTACSRSIGKNAFAYCTKLTEFPSHPSLTPKDGCFSNSGLSSYTILMDSFLSASGTVKVPQKLFQNCENLSDVKVVATENFAWPENPYLQYKIWYMNYAFEGCTSLTNIPLPDNNTLKNPVKVIEVNTKTFRNTGITTVDLTGYSFESGPNCFEGCTSLTSFKCNTVNLAAKMFAGCTKLQSLDVVDFTGTFDFTGISGCPIKSITFTSSTDSIKIPTAADDLNSIYVETVDISQFLTNDLSEAYNSGENEFVKLLKLPNLKKLTFTGVNNNYVMIDGAIYYMDSGMSHTPPEPGTIPKYLVCCSPDVISVTIPSTVTILGKYAFYGCSNLKTVVFPEGLEKSYYPESGTGASSNVNFLSYTGDAIDLTDMENFKGVTYSAKDGVDGLAMCPVLTFMADGKEVKKVAYLWNGSAEYPDVPEKKGYTGVWENIGTPVRDTVVNAVYLNLTISLKEGINEYKTYPNLSVGQIVTLSALDTENFIGWSINGLIVGAQYIVNINDADSKGIITMTAVFAKEDNDSWNLIVNGNGIDGKVFWTSSNAIGTYGMITALLGEFEDWGYEVSKNGVVGAISDSCLMVSSTDGEDVTVTVSFVDVGKSSDYSVSIAEIVSGGKSGFRATVTAEDDGYIDTDGTLAISYVYKTWNETDKVWVYTTSGSTAGVSDYCISISDKSIKTDVLTSDFTLETEGAILVYGYATYSYKDTSATSEITVTVASPVIVSFVSTIQTVTAKS